MVNPLQIRTLLLALGGNVPGRWGAPRDSLLQACNALEAAGVRIISSSHFYKSDPVGGGRQPRYLNAVVMVTGGMAPGSLLRLLKRIERRAGRRSTPPMQARPVDIDVLDYGGRRLNWPVSRRERGRLVLPHPLLHTRAFVLVPLLDVAPSWRHPVLGRRAKTLMLRLGPRAPSTVRKAPEPFIPDTA